MIIFQSPLRRAARCVVSNVTLGKGVPAGLNKGSMLWRMSLRGLPDFILHKKQILNISVLNKIYFECLELIFHTIPTVLFIFFLI